MPSEVITDEQLLTGIAQGDRDALNVLFTRYRSVAYRVAFRLLGNDADALDAVQEGFIKALKNLSGFRQDCAFKTWMMRVVSNAALDLGRKRQRWNKSTDSEPLEQEDWLVDAAQELPEETMDHLLLQEALSAALNKLPETQRHTFVLHVDGGLSYREVAETLDVSVGTVMSRLFYARQRLKLLLAAHVNP